MVHLKVGNYRCGCSKNKCDRDCITYRHLTHTESKADRIRAMTDEELADMMEDSVECPMRACPQDDKGANITRRDCRKCWLDWLKEEAEDGNHSH